jgi:hypothetical protein
MIYQELAMLMQILDEITKTMLIGMYPSPKAMLN